MSVLFLVCFQYPKTNIPQGDQDKCNYLKSTQMEDYQSPIVDRKARDTSFTLQSTSFKLGDPRLESYRSTNQDSYKYIPQEG